MRNKSARKVVGEINLEWDQSPETVRMRVRLLLLAFSSKLSTELRDQPEKTVQKISYQKQLRWKNNTAIKMILHLQVIRKEIEAANIAHVCVLCLMWNSAE